MLQQEMSLCRIVCSMIYPKARTTDLNLLVTLAALLETNNVSRAAEMLDLSQPAVSHALNRLREVFEDELLVRSGRVMLPTSRAEEMRDKLQQILAEVEHLLSAGSEFRPKESSRTFVIATNGYAAQLVIPRILNALEQEAPQANLRVIPTLHNDLRDLLADGQVDLCLQSGTIEHLPESLMMRSLYRDPFMMTAREDHPLCQNMTVEDFAKASHILVSPRGDQNGILDAVLADMGMRRRVALILPDFLIVPRILRHSDHVITTPMSLAHIFGDEMGLATVHLPPELEMNTGALIALWHERVHKDPMNQWFRNLVFEVSENALEETS